MDIWTIEEEAQRLTERFKGKNRAKFARDFGVPGGQVMVYQHITGRRPMSMEAAQAYARGFGCSLEEISPRLAEEAMKVVSGFTTTNHDEVFEKAIAAVERHLQKEDEEMLLSTYRSLPDDAKRIALAQIKALADLTSEKVNPVTAEKSGTMVHPTEMGDAGRQTSRAQGVTKAGEKLLDFDEAVEAAKRLAGVEGASRSTETKGKKSNQSG